MFNSDQNHDSLAFRIEQVEQNQQIMAEHIAQMKCQLDNLSQQVNNQPKLQQNNRLQDSLRQLNQQYKERQTLAAAPVEVVNLPTQDVSCSDSSQPQPTQVQSYENQLVFDRPGSRAVLMEALDKVKKRLIIVCPWLSRNSIDANLLQKFRDCLNRNCRIDIGWGYLSGRGKTGKGWGNNAIRDLKQLEQDYPEQFKLKLLGTHEKFLVCDDSFAMLGSHNMLTSNTQGVTREVGIRTTDPQIIQGLIDHFDGAFVPAIDENLTAGDARNDDADTLDTQYIGLESDAILMNPDDGATDQDIDDSVKYSQSPAIDASEFWRLYNDKERDFMRINLSGANLSEKSLKSDVNPSEALSLIEANLRGTNLSKANLEFARLLQANLNKANLSQARLYAANFTAADLSGANLMQANLQFANLTAADLSGAILTGADLSSTILTAANLSKAQLRTAKFSNTNLSGANLSKAQLTNVDLSGSNLSGANLTGANLAGINFNKVNLNGVTLSGANLCGSNLVSQNFSGVNLTKADLRGANLENVNLEKANLTGANIVGANFNGAKLSGTILPDGTVYA